MYSPSLEFLKSPIENVVNLLGGMPQDHEKALKHGFYNALAILLLMIALAAGWAVFIVLEPFFKPLLWALLCGSVLHPIKYSLADSMHSWLNNLSSKSSPLIWGITIIPIQLLDQASERIGSVIMGYIKFILILFVGSLLCHVSYSYTPNICICIIWKLGLIGSSAISWLMGFFEFYTVLTIVLGYIILLISFWTPQTAHYFTLGVTFVWLSVSFYLANLVPSFQVTIFFTLQFLLILGFAYEVFLLHGKTVSAGKHFTLCDVLYAICVGRRDQLLTARESVSSTDKSELEDADDGKIEEVKEKSSFNISELAVNPQDSYSDNQGIDDQVVQKPTQLEKQNEDKDSIKRFFRLERAGPSAGDHYAQRTPSITLASFQKQMFAAIHRQRIRSESIARPSRNEEQERPESTRYLYSLVWACTILSMWTYTWLLHATYILLLIYIIKRSGHYFHLWQTIETQILSLYGVMYEWYSSRCEAFFPLHVSGLFKLCSKLNDVILEILKNSVNMACCIIVISGVLVAVVSTGVFFTVQVYSESIHLLQVGSNLLNSSYIRNTKIMDGWQSQLDSILNDAYAYGRQGISSGVQHWLKDVDAAKATQLEEQVLELWDRIYQAWMTSGTTSIGPKVTTSAIYASFDSIVEDVQKTPELLNVAGIMAFLQENIGTLLTVFDSLWIILKGNLTLFMDSFMAIVMIVFGSGTAVINFFLNLIVFLTALFYLLASSDEMYKPVDLITKFSPNSGNRFAVALEDAIASVFHASIKRAIIYGLWTWLIHNFFQLRLVYIPSVLAALLGAIPFMPPYLPSIIAALELYFQDYTFYAVLLSLIQILSVTTIDTTIYKEIKGGGHPYLTALSIAGGMFWLGAEGVIMGPLLLCALFVAINMSTYILQGSDSEQELQEHMKHLSELGQLNQIRKSVTS